MQIKVKNMEKHFFSPNAVFKSNRHNPVPQERSLTQKSREVVTNETASQKQSTALYQFPPSDSSAKLHTLVTDARFPTQAGFSTSQRSDTV
jgi:hypothetical protein